MANIIHKRTKNNKGALKRALAVGEIGIVYGDDTAYFIVKDENGHVYEFVPDQNEVVVRSYIRLTVDDIEYNETPHPTATFINVTNLGNEIIDNNAEFTFTYKEEDCDNGTLLTDFTYNNEDTSRTICCTCESQGITTSITFNQSPVKFCIRYDSTYKSCDLDYPILINSETKQYIHISTNNCFTSEQAKNIHEIQFGSNSDYNICLSRLYLNLYPTHYLTSMSRMFSKCYNLTYLNLGKFDTSNVTSMTNMFFYCSSLTSLDLSNFDTSKVSSMEGMFYNCHSLESLDVSNFDTSNVTDMNQMFFYCSSLKSLNVSGWNVSNVSSMADMFSRCFSLKSLNVSGWNVSNVTSMTNMFLGCSSLESLNVSGWNTSNVSNMNSMFYGCTSLTSLDLSSFDTSNVTTIGGMFYNCSSLTSLDLSNWNTSNVSNMNSMFYGCISLTEINLSGLNSCRLRYSEHMFFNCSSLATFYLDNFSPNQLESCYQMFYGCPDNITIRTNTDFKQYLLDTASMNGLSGKTITWIDSNTVPMCSYFVATTTGGTYSYHPNGSANTVSDVESGAIVSVPTRWTTCRGLFSGSTNIETVDISTIDNFPISIDTHSMFRECPQLTRVVAPNIRVSSNPISMFRNSSSLTYIDIRNFTTNYTSSTELNMFTKIAPNATIIINQEFWKWLHLWKDGIELTRQGVSTATFKYGDGDDDIWTWPISE